jgi:hypothetical protein
VETGRHQQLAGRTKIAPSQFNARTLVVRAIEDGRTATMPHFTERCGQRGLSTIDAESLIRNGKYGTPRYDEEYDNWVYEIAGRVDGKLWKIVVALDCGGDLSESPRITLITAHRLGGKKKSATVRGNKNGDDDSKKVPSLQGPNERHKGELSLHGVRPKLRVP